MIRKYIPIISDTLFFAFSVFLLLASALMRVAPPPVSIAAAVTVSLFFAVGVFAFLSSRRKKRDEKAKEKNDAELYLLQLSFMRECEVFALFEKAFVNSGEQFTKTKNAFRLKSGVVYTPAFSIAGVNKADVIKLYNRLKKDEVGKIFCAFPNSEVKDFCARFGGRISLITGDKSFKFLEKNGALPKIKFSPANKNRKRFDAAVIFNKKRAKKYFLFGSVFTVMSFFIRLNAYYIAAGCLFLTLAAATFVFGSRPPEKKDALAE